MPVIGIKSYTKAPLSVCCLQNVVCNYSLNLPLLEFLGWEGLLFGCSLPLGRGLMRCASHCQEDLGNIKCVLLVQRGSYRLSLFFVFLGWGSLLFGCSFPLVEDEMRYICQSLERRKCPLIVKHGSQL